MNKLFVFIICCCNVIFSQQELTHEVYFETDKYSVTSTEENRLLLFISTLENIDIQSIAIFGFCDDIGAPDYNLVLSKQRANAIKTIFSDNEINESLITNVDGKGEILLRIISEKDVFKIRGLNRKVEIKVTPKPIIKEKIIVKEKAKTTAEILKGDIKEGDKIVLEHIYFNNGYGYPVSESKKTLEAIAKVLAERKGVYFTIQGHVCCTQLTRDAVDKKTKKRNLSEVRAKYVHDYFEKKGVDKRRMRYLGMRRKFPLGGDPKFDRRVEIVITYVGADN